MKVKVHQVEDSSESRAAEHIRKTLEERLRESEAGDLDRLAVHIIPNVQCFGSGTRDIDLVIILRDLRAQPFEVGGRKVRTMCLTVEVKDQTPRDVFFTGNECHVQAHPP